MHSRTQILGRVDDERVVRVAACARCSKGKSGETQQQHAAPTMRAEPLLCAGAYGAMRVYHTRRPP